MKDRNPMLMFVTMLHINYLLLFSSLFHSPIPSVCLFLLTLSPLTPPPVSCPVLVSLCSPLSLFPISPPITLMPPPPWFPWWQQCCMWNSCVVNELVGKTASPLFLSLARSLLFLPCSPLIVVNKPLQTPWLTPSPSLLPHLSPPHFFNWIPVND